MLFRFDLTNWRVGCTFDSLAVSWPSCEIKHREANMIHPNNKSPRNSGGGDLLPAPTDAANLGDLSFYARYAGLPTGADIEAARKTLSEVESTGDGQAAGRALQALSGMLRARAMAFDREVAWINAVLSKANHEGHADDIALALAEKAEIERVYPFEAKHMFRRVA